MKLRNKKTGEIFDLTHLPQMQPVVEMLLDGVMEKYEEPKDHWHIGCEGDVFIDNTERYLKSYSSIGNYFETKEEAEKAVEKLKAWKRLKDKGFRLSAVVDTFFCLDIYMSGEQYETIKDDLKIVFGDEE